MFLKVVFSLVVDSNFDAISTIKPNIPPLSLFTWRAYRSKKGNWPHFNGCHNDGKK